MGLLLQWTLAGNQARQAGALDLHSAEYYVPPVLLNPLNRRRRQRQGFSLVSGAFPLVGRMPAVATAALGWMRRAERELAKSVLVLIFSPLRRRPGLVGRSAEAAPSSLLHPSAGTRVKLA